ncbi:putative bacteriocin precursor, CLI_3235 family [Clostridium cavendishii DSM 21758]|uniref:Putative bacteriocin, CLI_3235 family n=1 Tax=Clostridium cavendishii DSM 21758 TaxID=1121302 RepID=A0A1M6R3T3_9CLOT|nr:CLI_3235 family bacteriocin precursor [Clostridium cavendishii]SHK27060.1 putative bacteriocin precursor, CLI_3235 family [Clostridium cavendishii DSM 21758]
MKKLGKKLTNSHETIEAYYCAYCNECSTCGCPTCFGNMTPASASSQVAAGNSNRYNLANNMQF